MVDLYESFYDLQRDPFRLSADHTFAYSHKSYRTALSYLKFAAYREEGFVMITGKPGTGKTTLISEILSGLNPDKVVTASLVTTQLESHDLLHMVASSFGLEHVGASKSTLLLRIEDFLRQNHESRRRVILLVDEAQGLTLDAIEELRQLSNLIVDSVPVLQTFLIGQDELRDLVRSPQLDQLRQRIVASSHLEPLTEEEVFAYVRHRLLVAGWNDDPQIANAVVKLVHHYSNGIPRKINLIFGRLLLHGFTEGKHILMREDMEAVIRELEKELLIFDTETAQSDVYGPEACTGFLDTGNDVEEQETTGETDVSDHEENAVSGVDEVPGIDVVPVDNVLEVEVDPLPETDDEVIAQEEQPVVPRRKFNFLAAFMLLLLLVLVLAGLERQRLVQLLYPHSAASVSGPPAGPGGEVPAPQSGGIEISPKSGLIRRDTGPQAPE